MTKAAATVYEEVLRWVFAAFDEKKISYCIVRNYEDLPCTPGNDVDILVDKNDLRKFHNVMLEIPARFSWLRIPTPQRLCYTFLNRYTQDGLCFHVRTDFAIGPVVYMNAGEILDSSRRYSIFFVPEPGSESITLFMECFLGKGYIKQKYRESIRRGYHQNPERFFELLRICLRDYRAEKICHHIAEESWDDIEPIWTWSLQVFPMLSLDRVLREGVWRVRRCFQRRGLFVTLLGVDGAGKTTVADYLGKTFRGRFPAVQTCQGPRPCYLLSMKKGQWLAQRLQMHGEQQPVTADVSSRTQGKQCSRLYRLQSAIVDFAKLVFYLLDIWAGYLFAIHPLRKRGGIYVMSRYFYCEIAYGGDRWHIPLPLLRLLSKFVPKPDLTILLYDDPEVIHGRKGELPVEKIAEYQVRYERIGESIRYFKKIRTDESAEVIGERVKQKILERLGHGQS